MSIPSAPYSKFKETGRYLIGIGLVLFCFSGVQAWNSNEFLRNSAVANGTVVRMDTAKRNSGGHTTSRSYPVVRFTDASGVEQEAYAMHSLWDHHQIGDAVPMIYNPESPADARENSFMSIWGWAAGLSMAGMVFIIAGWKWIHRTQ